MLGWVGKLLAGKEPSAPGEGEGEGAVPDPLLPVEEAATADWGSFHLLCQERVLVRHHGGLTVYRLDSGAASSPEPWRHPSSFGQLEIAGNRIALASDSHIELWDISCLEGSDGAWHPKEIARLPLARPGSPGQTRTLALNGDGSRLLCLLEDGLSCLDAAGQRLFTVPLGARFLFLPDGRFLVSDSTRTHVYDVDGKRLTTWIIALGPALISLDGRWALDAGRLIDTPTGIAVAKQLGHWKSAAFSPDSRWLALGNSSGLLRIIDLDEMADLEVEPVEECAGHEALTLLWTSPSSLLVGRSDGLQVGWLVAESARQTHSFPLTGVQGATGPYVVSLNGSELGLWRHDGSPTARLMISSYIQ